MKRSIIFIFITCFAVPFDFAQGELPARALNNALHEIYELEDLFIKQPKAEINNAQEDHFKTPKEASVNGLNLLKGVCSTDKDAIAFGWRSAVEAQKAKLDKHFFLHAHVDKKKLANYKKGDNPADYLNPVKAIRYLITLNGDGRFVMDVKSSADPKIKGWLTVLWGYRKTAESISQILKKYPNSKPGDFIYVDADLAHADFLVKKTNDPKKLEFFTLFNEPKLNLKAGDVTTADTLFPKLSKIKQK